MERPVPLALPTLLTLVLLGGGCASSEPETSSGEAEAQAQARADYQRWWNAFLDADPQWPEYRAQWLARGPRDRERLLELLLVEMVGGNQVDEGGDQAEPPWKRCGSEFRYLGSDAVRPLVQSMRVLLGRKPVDRVSVDRLGRALGEVAEADELVALLLEPGAADEMRMATARVLTAMQSPSAVDALVELATKDPDWRVRGAAVEGLSPWAPRLELGEASAFSRDALVGAMEDPDPYVRKVACRGLSRVRLPTVQHALVDRLDRARRDGDSDLAAELVVSLQTSLRQTGPVDPNAWRALIEDEGA